MEVFDKIAAGPRINNFRMLLQDGNEDEEEHVQKIVYHISPDSKFPSIGPEDPSIRKLDASAYRELLGSIN